VKIAVLGAGHIGSTVGRLWHAAGHEVTFAARDIGDARAKIEATVKNAEELLALVHTHGSIGAYLASFPDARSAAADLHRRFRFLGDTGVWRLLTSAARDLGR
jgi:predicted dinucleotide-binding enzyme